MDTLTSNQKTMANSPFTIDTRTGMATPVEQVPLDAVVHVHATCPQCNGSGGMPSGAVCGACSNSLVKGKQMLVYTLQDFAHAVGDILHGRFAQASQEFTAGGKFLSKTEADAVALADAALPVVHADVAKAEADVAMGESTLAAMDPSLAANPTVEGAEQLVGQAEAEVNTVEQVAMTEVEKLKAKKASTK